MLQHFKSRVIEKNHIDHDVVLLRLKLIEPARIEFIAGQYLLLNIPKDDGGVVLRHFSIASSVDEKSHVDLIAKLIHRGVASTYIGKLNIDDEVLFSGPAGIFKIHPSASSGQARDKVFLATGTGIAPIKSMLTSILNPNKKIPSPKQILNSKFQLFWGLRHYEDIYFLDEFKKLSQEHSNFKFKICLSREKEIDGEHFTLGRVNGAVDQAILDSSIQILNSDFYVCGNRDSVESIRQYLYQKGAPQTQVFFEKF